MIMIDIGDGDGDDSIKAQDSSNTTIIGGAGNDEISLSAYTENNVVNYSLGDGNDTVWGLSENSTLNIFADDSLISSVGNDNDVIITVGENTITLIDARDKPPHVIIGKSGTEGGGSNSGNDSGNNSSSGDGNGGRGGNDGGNVSGGTSANEGMNSDASGNKSAIGSRGRGLFDKFKHKRRHRSRQVEKQ